jgi:uncharacterized protein
MTEPVTAAEAFAARVAELALEPLPLDQATVLAGKPAISALVLDSSPDGTVERGVWQMTAGTVTDVEADELFVVLSGRATVEVADGPTLELEPGTVGLLRAGDRTRWRVHETLRKVYQVTSAPAGRSARPVRV